jgi:hypothetical protein
MFKGVPNAKRREFEHNGRLVVIEHDDSWFFFDCDTCGESFCKDCADADDDGNIECHGCLAERLRKA